MESGSKSRPSIFIIPISVLHNIRKTAPIHSFWIFRHLAGHGETMRTTRAVAKAFCTELEPEFTANIERSKPASAVQYGSAGRGRYDQIAL